MLDYVAKLTLTPARMTKDDVVRLRRHGFGDRDILDIAMMTGLFAYFNRIADGLGIELEAPYR